MKRKDLERTLLELGWWLKRHGSKHDVWTNGEDDEAHNEVNEMLAKKILRTAERAPKKG